ncbi:hypothetical protein [Acinetobacter sp. 3657]|uniref:hypothetical protein n=1 Tax=Acinetobacter sp. 3657 TaxID=2817764 RepID=UPI0028649BC6|nr:hypothetical protein [Prolinoborus sp. 3657]
MLKIFSFFKLYLVAISFIIFSVQGCSGAFETSEVKTSCQINLDEDNKFLEKAPCLDLPISSMDFEDLPKLENGWYYLEKTNFIVDENGFFSPESHSLARVLGYIKVNEKYSYILLLQNIDMEGDGPAQSFMLLKVDTEGNLYGGNYAGYHRFNFSKNIEYNSETGQIDFKEIAKTPYHGECKQDFVINEDFSLKTRKICTNKIDLDRNYIEEK